MATGHNLRSLFRTVKNHGILSGLQLEIADTTILEHRRIDVRYSIEIVKAIFRAKNTFSNKMSDSDDDSDDTSKDEVQEICSCLLRENCYFNKERNSIRTSQHWCLNYRNKSCINRFWGPCLETAEDNESICRFCEDKNDLVSVAKKRPKSSMNRNNGNSSNTDGRGGERSNSSNNSSNNNLTNAFSALPMGGAEIAEAVESEFQLTVAYDKDISETDEAAMFIRTCKESDKKTIQQQLSREFFIFICCLIGQETTTNMDKMHINDIYKSCFVAFGKYLIDGGRAFLLNTTAILHQLTPTNGWPDGVYSTLEQFMQKEYNLGTHQIRLTHSTCTYFHSSYASLCLKLGTKEARRTVGSEADKSKACNILRGSEVWNTFKAAQKSANVYNSSWRKLKSGENKSGLLRQIRESLWPIEEKQKNIKRVQTRASSKKFNSDEEKVTWIATEIDDANKKIELFSMQNGFQQVG